MINWMYYPNTKTPDKIFYKIKNAFEAISNSIDSENHHLESNEVLKQVSP